MQKERDDYLRYLIWHSLESIVFMTVALVIYLVRVIRKKPLARSLDRKEDIICKLIIGCILAYTFYFGVFPQTRDIPNIINKNIYTVEGVAQGYNEPTRSKKISVHILDDETQEDVYVTFYYEKVIKDGDRLVVQYLPNSKFGVLIERNGEIIETRIE